VDALPEASPEANKDFIEGFNTRMAAFMPDFTKRKLSCEIDRFADRSDEGYYAVTTLEERIPTQPFTQLEFSLSSTERTGNETLYRISVKNIGKKDAAEVNFRSMFGDDTKLVSFTPSQGRCQRSSWGHSAGSMVCYLGRLRSGEDASIEFRGSPFENPGGRVPPSPNDLWEIFGAAKENPDDPWWKRSWFRFHPLESHKGESKR
jgi:hypothetical protein